MVGSRVWVLVGDCDRLPESIASSDEFESGEEVADFEGGGFRGVGTVRAVHLDAGAEIVANRAGRGFFRIGGTHGFAPFRNGAIGFEDHGENFARAHEVGKFTEEGTLAVDGIEASGFFFGESHGFDGNEFETSFVDAGEDFALEVATDSVRFDDRECTFNRHEAFLRSPQNQSQSEARLYKIKKLTENTPC